MPSIIELNDVSYSYEPGAPRVLEHISLHIADGSFTGIIGPSGAGKSTLVNLINGAIPHHFGGELFGSVMVGGQDTCTISLTDIARIVGSVQQDIDAQMVASEVEDELLFGLENFGTDHDRIEGLLSGALDAVGIADLRHRDIATLSGGQKQKVAIAAILALAPRVLVLDEPTAALDPMSSRMVFDTLKLLNEQQGITVIVVEQKVALLSEYCSRLVVMDKGAIAYDGTPREVFSHGAELHELGVDSPRVARISNSLAHEGLCPAGAPCLNVDEAAALVASLVPAARPDTSSPRNDMRTPAAPSDGAASRPHAVGAEPVISFSDVCFSYPNGGAAVEHIDLAVYPGELVGVVGQNGAGKTTVTKLLNGLLRPASGHAVVAGHDTSSTPVSVLARDVATLFQNPDRQLCKNTVVEEVAFGLELAGVPTSEARERAARAIERFGLPADEAPFSLSRGERQMVALASVVVLDPAVVLLDEPTSGLDYRECMTVMETVREMAERGCAVVMVCHDMEVVSDFAERLVVMADGRIISEGAVHEVFADERLMHAAGITPPQVIALSNCLETEVDPAFAHLSEVSEVVATVKELISHA